MCVFNFLDQTYHDSSYADAHIPNDVEFAVEEVLNACFTVLQTKYMRSHVSSRKHDGWYGTIINSLHKKRGRT